MSGIRGDDADDMVQVRFTVCNARPVHSKTVFALVDVEVQVAGVTFDVCGVQARRQPDGQTAVGLPTFKDEGGAWRPAIRFPEEVRKPLGDAVLAFMLEEGLAKRRFDVG